jgi:hypothetical protein
MSFILSLLFLALVAAIGYCFVMAVYGPAWSPGALGMGMFSGAVGTVLSLAVFPSHSRLVVTILTGLVLLGTAIRWRLHGVEEAAPIARFDRTLAIAGLVVMGAYFLMIWRMVGYDETYNFHFASQYMRGHCPPSSYAFPGRTASYHYGWGVLLGALSKAGGLTLPIASDLLTLYMLTASVLMVYGFTARMGWAPTGRALGIVLLFLGGGFFILPCRFLLGEWRNGMGSLTMFQSHPWTFGYGFFSYLLLFSSDEARRYQDGKRIPCVPLLLPLLGVPVVNATTVSLLSVFVACLGIMCFAALAKRDCRGQLWSAGAMIAAVLLVVAMWPFVGGVFADGTEGARRGVAFAPFYLGGRLYIKYMVAYVLMAPAGAIGMLLGLCVVTRRKAELAEYGNLPETLLYSIAILLFPVPFVVWFPSFPAWDNLCKFSLFSNFAGFLTIALVLANWITKPTMAQTRRRLILAAIALVAGHETVIQIVQKNASDSHRSYRKELAGQADLLDFVRSQTQVQDRILVLSREMDEFYPSEETAGEKTNLWAFLGSNYGLFTYTARETGAAFVNFQILNHSVPGTLEDDLRVWLNKVHREGPSAEELRKWQVRYVLCRHALVPEEHIRRLLAAGVIEVAAESIQEGWVCWRTHG